MRPSQRGILDPWQPRACYRIAVFLSPFLRRLVRHLFLWRFLSGRTSQTIRCQTAGSSVHWRKKEVVHFTVPNRYQALRMTKVGKSTSALRKNHKSSKFHESFLTWSHSHSSPQQSSKLKDCSLLLRPRLLCYSSALHLLLHQKS